MRKNILTALFALLAVALNGNAQNNTYNMVIEMANGTTITIGPNDVKNISFNNGELVMTGEDINSLVKQQNMTNMRIDSLENVIRSNFETILALSGQIRYELDGKASNEWVDYLRSSLEDSETDLKYAILELQNRILASEAHIDNLSTSANYAWTDIENSKGQIYDLQYQIKDLEQIISELRNRIIELENK